MTVDCAMNEEFQNVGKKTCGVCGLDEEDEWDGIDYEIEEDINSTSAEEECINGKEKIKWKGSWYSCA